MSKLLKTAVSALTTIYRCLILLGDAIAVIHALSFFAVGCIDALHLVGIF